MNPVASKISNGRTMLLSKCVICGNKKQDLLKKQEAKRLLCNLGLKTLLSNIPILGDVLFCMYKMNDIVKKYLLAGDKFMPEMHLKQPGFTYSASGIFTKNKERIQKFKETGDAKYIYKNELDKACFQHDMAYGDFKDLARRPASDKVLRGKAFNIAKNPKYDRYQRGLASMVYTFFDKRTSRGAIAMPQNEQLAEELHKPIIRKFKKEKFIHLSKTIFGVLL